MNQIEEHHLKPIFIDQSFNNFDLFLDSIQDWDLEFYKLDKAPFTAKINRIISTNISLMDVKLNSRLDQHGHPPHGVRSIAIPADPKQHFHWRKKLITSNRIGVWPLGGDLNAVSSTGFHVYVLSISDEFLNSVSHILGTPTLTEMLKGDECLDISQSEMTKLQFFLADFLNDMITFPEFEINHEFRKQAEFEVARSLLLAIASSRFEAKIPPSRFRDEGLQRALDYITSSANEAPRISDVCQAACISERTLQFAFLDHFGISPKQYLNFYRLNAVRRELHFADPSSSTVKQIAAHWGFWHMGKLGGDYYNLFGELPSETLKKKNKVYYRK